MGNSWEPHGDLKRKNLICHDKTFLFGLIQNASYLLLYVFVVMSDGETGVSVVPAVPEGTVATPGDRLPVLRLL